MFAIFWSFTSIDVIIAKRVMPAGMAGDYACAVFMGKIILFLPAAVGVVMFPKTAELWARRRKTIEVFFSYFLTGVIMSGFVGILYIAIPRMLISLLYGDEYLAAAKVMGMFGVAMTFYTALNILIMYFVSINISRIPVIVMAAAITVEIITMSFLARTMKQFAAVHLVISTLLVSALFLVVVKIAASERALADTQHSLITRSKQEQAGISCTSGHLILIQKDIPSD